jgi:hypothetical protein
VTAGDFSEKAAKILIDLELSALRAKYRSGESLLNDRRPGAFSYFYMDPYEFVDTPAEQEQQQIEAQALNEIPRVLVRYAELATVGIRPWVVSYGEPGNSHLTMIVEFNERGRRTLEGSNFALSEIVRFARRFLWIGYYVIGAAVLAVVFVDRIARIPWWQILVSLVLTCGFIVLIRRFWRSKA